MTQADFTVANQTFPNTRAEINTSLQALATNSAGNSAPSTTYANQWWFDSDDNQLYIRNKDNDSWCKVFTVGATSDKIESIADSISIASTGGVTITTADNTDTLSLISTDADANVGPNLRLYRNSSSPADNDALGFIEFEGRNDNSQDVIYGSLEATLLDASDGTEDGELALRTMIAGTKTNQILLKPEGFIFNENSGDLDFRVESNDNTHMLFVDGGSNRVGVGTAPDLGAGLHIRVSDSGGTVNGNYDTLVIEESGHSGIEILSGTSSTGLIGFGDSGAALRGYIAYSHSNDHFEFATSGTERLRLTSGGFAKFHNALGSHVAAAQFHEFTNTSGSQQILYLNHTDSSNPYGLQINFSGAVPDDNTHWFFICTDSTAARMIVRSDGDVDNHDNSYGSISDERIKQDIVDANSQWEDIKAVKIRNFKKKDDVRQYGDNAWSQIGVIAQELEAVSPKLINENDPTAGDIISSSEFGTLYTSDDAETQDAVLYVADDQEVIDGDKNVGDIKTPSTKQIGDVKDINTKVKSVKYSVLYMKAIKALQEAMTKIEDLEARLTTLEG